MRCPLAYPVASSRAPLEARVCPEFGRFGPVIDLHFSSSLLLRGEEAAG